MLASMMWLTLINVNFIVIWYTFCFCVVLLYFSYLFIIISPKFKLFSSQSFVRHDPIECNLIIVTTKLV